MIETLSIGGVYISHHGYPCKIVSLAKHGQDCSVAMVVYTNLKETFDSPEGSLWVVEESFFLRRFREQG